MYHNVGLQPTNASLRLRVDRGVLTASWIQPDDVDEFALIVKVRFVKSGCQWSSAPLYPASSNDPTVSIDVRHVTSLRGASDSDSLVHITAHLCRLLCGNPKGWKVTSSTVISADVGLAAHNQDLESLFHRHLHLSSQSSLQQFRSAIGK